MKVQVLEKRKMSWGDETFPVLYTRMPVWNRIIPIWYHKDGKRGTGRIYLSYVAGKNVERVKEELNEFLQEKEEE